MTEKESKFAGLLRNRQEGAEPEAAIEPKPKRGRPGGKGKRVDPNYAQVTAYIPKKIYEETKIILIQQGNREFSVLVEELLVAWIWKQGGKN